MSDKWRDEMQLQNDHLRAQLAALAKSPPRVRRKYQLLVVRCQGCGDVMLEVLKTEPYAVIRLRGIEPGEFPAAPAGATMAEARDHWREFFADRQESIRLDAHWTFVPIAWPPSSDHDADRRDSSVHTACKCRDAGPISMRWIFEKLAAGQRDITLPRRDN